MSECFDSAVRRWSKNGTDESIDDSPVPSRSRRSSIDDSLVVRLTDAVRGAVTALWSLMLRA